VPVKFFPGPRQKISLTNKSQSIKFLMEIKKMAGKEGEVEGEETRGVRNSKDTCNITNIVERNECNSNGNGSKSNKDNEEEKQEEKTVVLKKESEENKEKNKDKDKEKESNEKETEKEKDKDKEKNKEKEKEKRSKSKKRHAEPLEGENSKMFSSFHSYLFIYLFI